MSKNETVPETASKTSRAGSPLSNPIYRSLWIAALVSNIGTWMHDVGASWVMTSISDSPLMVSLLQTATSLPFLFLALPAGALADVLDRRHLLLFSQTVLFLAAGLISACTFYNVMTAELLLALTLLLGIGNALNMPAWQAIIPELVTRRQLPSAAALSAVSINIGRAIGPAIGGAVIAASSPAVVFALNALSFLAVIFVLFRWKRVAVPTSLPSERILSAMTAGVRYALFANHLQTVLIRTAIFFLFGNALWALLPVIGRHELGMSAAGYGLLLGALGIGAILGALSLPRLRSKFSSDTIVMAASAAWGGLMLFFALAKVTVVLYAAMFIGGFCWISIVSTLNAAAQISVPDWVRGRAVALNLLVFQGSIAIGGVAWGLLAARTGTSTALIVACAGVFVGLSLAAWRRLPQVENLDLTPSAHWSEPDIATGHAVGDGPALVTVEYQVSQERVSQFVLAFQSLEQARRRDGAYHWGLYQDVEKPSTWIETFVIASWAEHLRQHARVTIDDRKAEAAVRLLLVDGSEPIVRHFVAKSTTLRAVLPG
jgi:MFS family permease